MNPAAVPGTSQHDLLSTDDPAAALRRAAELSGRARRSSRWYVRYLLVFAVGSFAMSVLTGAFPGGPGVAVTTGLWAVFLAVTTGWISRKQTAIRGMTPLHLTVMAGWTVAWLATVLLGTSYFRGDLWWWVLGGAAVAACPAVGAVVAHRRSR